MELPFFHSLKKFFFGFLNFLEINRDYLNSWKVSIFYHKINFWKKKLYEK